MQLADLLNRKVKLAFGSVILTMLFVGGVAYRAGAVRVPGGGVRRR